jgi:hypothetical protein
MKYILSVFNSNSIRILSVFYIREQMEAAVAFGPTWLPSPTDGLVLATLSSLLLLVAVAAGLAWRMLAK